MRKIILCVVLVALSAVISSCSDHQERLLKSQTEDIWLLSDSALDEAVRKADNLKKAVETSSSDEVRNRFDLLCIRLRDKQLMTPSSADSAKQVVRYFKRHGSKIWQMRAYYYMGSIYRDLHDSPHAMQNFLAATGMAEKGQCSDTLMMMKCYSQLMHLYARQLNYEEALNMALRGYETGKRSGMLDPWYVMDVASACMLTGDSIMGLGYMDEAYDMMRRRDERNAFVPTLTVMLAAYSRMGVWAKADSIAGYLQDVPEEKRPYNYDLNFGIYHQSKGNEDAAALHYHQLFENTRRISCKCDAAKGLMLYYQKKGDFRMASEYAEAYQAANDSTIRERQFELTRNALGEYRYQRDKASEEALLLRSERLRLWAVTGFSLCLLAALAFLTYYYYRKKRFYEIIVGLETEIKATRQRLLTDQQKIDEKNRLLREKGKELATLDGRLQEAKEQIKDAEMQLKTTMEQLQQRIAHNNDLMKMLLEGEAKVKEPMTNEELKAVALGKSKMEDWQRLYATVNRMHPDFAAMLQKTCKRLKEPMIQTAYLMQMGLSATEIARVMDAPVQTIWNRLKRLQAALNEKR